MSAAAPPSWKIMHISATLNRGGCENYLAELLTRQKAAGHDVTVAYLKGDGYWAQPLRDNGVRVVGLGVKRYGDIPPIWRLRRLINQIGPDILHAHLAASELYAALAMVGMRQKPAFVIGKHNDEPFYRGPGQRLVGTWIGRKAAKFIAVSDVVKRHTCSELDQPASRVEVVHYGIDPRPFERVGEREWRAIRVEWNVPENAILIGTAARFAEQKALHILLSGYAQYRKMATLPSQLAVLGRGPLERELRSLAVQLNIADQVIWPGFRQDMNVIMNAFDIFALTSVREALGLVFLEAMSASKPVIATAVGGVPDVVQHEETGLLCPVNSSEDIAKAILRCEDADLRRRLGVAGHARVIEAFTVDDMVNKIFNVYREVVADASRHRTVSSTAVVTPSRF
jgi:glycosyltransferase involved in cell wall biosynthesis